jgi:hypothetical protein
MDEMTKVRNLLNRLDERYLAAAVVRRRALHRTFGTPSGQQLTTRFDVPIGVLPPSFMTNPKSAQR